MNAKEQIMEHEQKLFLAIQQSDVQMLDELIHDDLLFNIPTGQTGTKAMDLDAYASGNMRVQSAVPSDYTINIIDNVAVVCVTVALKAEFFGQPVDSTFRYNRVWLNIGKQWKIISGSCIQMSV
jgi:hypothetical protein